MSFYFHKRFERSFGTGGLHGEAADEAIGAALEVGYRAFDTAQMYGNEADVGRILGECRVPREQLCVTTKVHPDNFSEERFIPSVRESLEKLRTEQADVLLLHWPPMGGDVEPSLRLLEQAADLGLARHIGVSNYTAAMMERARARVSRPLVTNQVEFHPLLDQSKLLQAAARTGIPLSSYCSVARGEVFKHPEFAEIGRGYGVSAVQVVLRWILQKGVSINTLSAKRPNVTLNFDVMGFTLSSVDMARIDAMNKTGYRIVTRELSQWAPDWD